MHRKLGNFLMLCGVLALLGAAGLLLYNHVENRLAGEAAHQVMVTVREEISHTTDAPRAHIRSMTTAEIDGLDYIGYLSLPTVDRELPILAQLTMPGLQIAPGRYSGSTYTNDLVLAAHNFDFHFGPISRLSPGDPVLFTDMDGMVSHYEVVGTEILQPAEIDKMVHSDADLTLFTCTYGGASRVTVRCQRVYP